MADDKAVDTADQVRPFAAFLHDQRGGVLHSELSEALAEISQAVMEHNKGGKLTLEITVKPAGTAEHTLFVGDKITSKIPEADKPTSMFFADEQGNLSRRDPRQAELPLREVGGSEEEKPSELRKAGSSE